MKGEMWSAYGLRSGLTLVPVIFALVAPIAKAQVAPDAGSTLRQQQPPVLDLPPNPQPPLQTEPSASPPLPAAPGLRFVLNGLRITGQTAFTERELLKLVQDFVGKDVGFVDLEQAAARVSLYYREHGYIVARAYLPAQDIRGGIVEIVVLEGHIGRVVIENRSRVRDGVIASRVESLQGQLVRDDDIESRLRLTYELIGIGPGSQAALRPGANVGESDLVLQLDPEPLVSGSVAFDNYGNRFTGGNRATGQVGINSPTGSGDFLFLKATLGAPNLRVYNASYQLPIGDDGLRFGGDYSRVEYELGRDFSALAASGTADTWQAFASHPLALGRTYSVRAQVSYQESNIEDRIGATATITDKLSRLGTVALTADWRDAFIGGGASAASLSYGVGDLDILSPEARAIDSATAHTQGGFQKWVLSLTRLQRLTESTSLYLLFTGQKADKNLDSSEKLILGGAYGVKAYPEGEAPGDTGYLLNAELRYDLWNDWIPGHAQLLALVDTGQVTTNERPFAPGSNDRALSSLGLGFDLAIDLGFDLSKFDLRLLVAHKLGSERATSDTDQAIRGWLQLTKRF